MGYTKHHAIIVSSWNDKALKEIHQTAFNIFDKQVSSIVRGQVNLTDTFMIGPDGENDDHPGSEIHDEKRFEFICYLENYKYEDGSSCISFVELSYGDEVGLQPEIINRSF